MERTLVKETKEKVGEKVKLTGWINSIRDHGKLTFIDLRDRTGLVQLIGKELPKASAESVVEVIGKVAKRPEKLINENLETGEIEIQIEKLEVVSKAKEMPIPLDTDGYEIKEGTRLKYRYLDLRRERLTKNIRLRSKAINFIRSWLLEKDFVDIETPILTKTTPEGARDFLVPSRLQPGKFYALPQSPQQYKQLLMVSGFEKYFQIARCFRDEDPRADRAYGEFTQLDIEMSFTDQEEILKLTEQLFTDLIKKVFPEKKITKEPWPRFTHAEAMKKYGSDKPDLREDKKDLNELAFCWIVDFPLFVKQEKEDFYHGIGKAKYAPSHHMFTAPHPDDVFLLDKDPLKVRGLQHDMILNGHEVGGGSIRIHQSELQEKIFKLIGFDDKQKKQFEHLLRAFEYGVPPHGGIAPGIDRFLYTVLGERSLREVIAFPMTAGGTTAVMEAPSKAGGEQLEELGIKVKESRDQKK